MLLSLLARLGGYVGLRTSIGPREYAGRELAAQVAIDAGAVDEEITVDVLGNSIAATGHDPP